MPKIALTLALPLALLVSSCGKNFSARKPVAGPGTALRSAAPAAAAAGTNAASSRAAGKTSTALTKTSPAAPARPAPAGKPTADSTKARDIVKRSDDLMRGNSNQGIYTMTVHTPDWQRRLKLHVYSLGRDKIFIRILEPAKEAGIGTLRIGNEMWNYLPSVERIIKIPPSLMMESWMGSDFANDDLVKESSLVHDYTHKILAEEKVDGWEAYKIRLLPKPNAAVIWGKVIRWIRKKDDVPLREEYYSDRGELIKVLTFSDIGPVSDRVIPRTWTMRSVKKKDHYTVIKLKDVTYDQPIDKNIFSMMYLKRAQ